MCIYRGLMRLKWHFLVKNGGLGWNRRILWLKLSGWDEKVHLGNKNN